MFREMKWIALFPLVQFYPQLLFRRYNWINQLSRYGSVASPKCQWWGIPCVLNDMRSHQFNRCSRLCNSFSKSSSNHTICSFSGSKLNFNCNMALNFKSRRRYFNSEEEGRQVASNWVTGRYLETTRKAGPKIFSAKVLVDWQLEGWRPSTYFVFVILYFLYFCNSVYLYFPLKHRTGWLAIRRMVPPTHSQTDSPSFCFLQ